MPRRPGQLTFNEAETILQDLPIGVGIFDNATRAPLFLNDQYYQLLEYSKEDYQRVIAENYMKLVFPADLSQDSKIVTNSDEYRVICKNGNTKWVKLSVSSILIDGTEYALTFFFDITNEKDATANLKLVTDNIDCNLSLFRIKNGKETLIYANNRFFETIGLDKDYYQNHTAKLDMDFASEKGRIDTHNAISESLETGKAVDVEYQFTGTNGKTTWMNRRLKAIREDDSNSILLISIVTNITGKRNLEAKELSEQKRQEKEYFDQIALASRTDKENCLFECRYNLTRESMEFYDCKKPITLDLSYDEIICKFAELALTPENKQNIIDNFSKKA